MRKNILLAPLAFLFAASSISAQEEAPKEYPSPNAIVDAAPASEWVAIAPSDLLVMDLEPDAQGNERRVIIQLMPPPFSQGWIRNIRKLAAAKFWDDTSINRVQDNYVVQWGDAGYDNPESGEVDQKALPEGLEVVPESSYIVTEPEIYKASNELYNRLHSAEKKNITMIPDPDGFKSGLEKLQDPRSSEAEHHEAVDQMLKAAGLAGPTKDSNEWIDILSTQRPSAKGGWHERDSYAEWVENFFGWPIAAEGDGDDAVFWPVHCYGSVGVGRGYSPDTGTGAELYTVIGHAPRHLDRNIAVVGRIIEGMEHLSSLPRGKGQLGFYAEPKKRVPIKSIRLASSLPKEQQPKFEYLDTEFRDKAKSRTFNKYIDARANRRDPFFIKPAGGADICNIPVPVRRVAAE